MKIIDKVWVFDYLMEIFMIMTMVCGQSLLTNSLNSLGYISIHISFIIYCLFYRFLFKATKLVNFVIHKGLKRQIARMGRTKFHSESNGWQLEKYNIPL